MILKTVRRSVLGKLKPSFEISLPDFASKKSIPIRHIAIGFKGKEIDTEFYQNNEFASMVFYTLSVFLTYGEDLVIETARHHRSMITDPILRQRVTALIGQEALHSKLHNEFNDALKDVNYPVTFYRFLGENFFKYIFLKFPQPLKLSMMAGIEHFTAVLAEYVMKNEEVFYYSDDEKTRAMWMWHMLEESEHKDIAYDVYQVLSGNYALRVSGFLLAFVTIIGLVPFAGTLVPVFRKPRDLVKPKFWKDAARGVNLLFGPTKGIFGSNMGQIFDYMRPDFHPNDHDTTEYLEHYKKTLFAEGGVLAPFFVKEFTPAVRAA